MYCQLINKLYVTALVFALIFSGALFTQNVNAENDDNELVSVDLSIINAQIYTANPNQIWAQAVAIKDGKFLYVGDRQGANKFNAKRTVNLNGKVVIPALIDGHAHPGYVNVEQFGLVEGDTPAELLDAVQKYAAANPDKKWLRLCCWPTEMFVNSRGGPQKEILDAIIPDRLLWFESETAHDYWLNSKALAEIGVDKYTIDPKSGLAEYVRDETGEPTGWVKEGAGVQHFAKHFALRDKTHIQKHKESVAKTLQVFSQHGVTALFDAGNKGFGDHVYRVIAELEKEGKLPLRYFGTYQIFTPQRAKKAISEIRRYRRMYASEMLKFNSVKIFMDGITANRSAAYMQAYRGKDTRVEPLLSTTELTTLLIQLHQERLDLMVHSIGDRSTKTVLDAVEAAQASVVGKFYPRVTIAHLTLIDPPDLPRMKALGVIANFTPWWFGAYRNDISEKLLGKQRYNSMYRAKTVFDTGATVTFSSDEWWGGEMLATYISPYLGMQIGHTRQNPRAWLSQPNNDIRAPINERLSLQQLVKGYTANGAYQLRLEQQLGSIEKGKAADLLVLNKNLFTSDIAQLYKLQPTAVLMNGRVMQGSLP